MVTINVCFVNASVTKMRLKRLWDLKGHKEYTLSDPLPPGPNGWRTCPSDGTHPPELFAGRPVHLLCCCHLRGTYHAPSSPGAALWPRPVKKHGACTECFGTGPDEYEGA